eukprot:5053261-Amphidinium_carterae.1
MSRHPSTHDKCNKPARTRVGTMGTSCSRNISFAACSRPQATPDMYYQKHLPSHGSTSQSSTGAHHNFAKCAKPCTAKYECSHLQTCLVNQQTSKCMNFS